MDVSEAKDEEFFETRVVFVFDDHWQQPHEWCERGFEVMAQADDEVVFLSEETVDLFGFLCDFLFQRCVGTMECLVFVSECLFIVSPLSDGAEEEDTEDKEATTDKEAEEEVRKREVGKKELEKRCGGEEERLAGGVQEPSEEGEEHGYS
jgi:hypothetical protein